MRFAFAAAAAAFLSCAPASAAIVTVDFSGVIDFGPGGVGSTFAGRYSYDTAETGTVCDVGAVCRRFNFFDGSLTARGETLTFTSAGAPLQQFNSIQITDEPDPANSFLRLFKANAIVVNLLGFDGPLGTALPGSISLSDADRSTIAFYLPSSSVDFYNGTLTSLTSSSVEAVPEPTTWALMILGFGAVGSALRSSQRRLQLA